LNIIFHPFAPPTLLGRFVPFWQVWSDCRRNHPSQISSRLIQGFGATGAPNLELPIDFDSRPYNSVMYYRATLIVSCTFLVQRKLQDRSCCPAPTYTYTPRHSTATTTNTTNCYNTMQLQELAAAAATITTTVTTYQWRKALRRNMARNCSETRLNSSCMAVLLPMNVAAIFSPLHKYITATSSYTT